MENASKALIIAGGVLIAIIIISLLVRTYGNISFFQRQQVSSEEAERIESYNKEYTKYLNQYVYGTEVITAINRALNEKEKNNNDMSIDIKFTKEEYQYTITYWKNGTKREVSKTVKKGQNLSIYTTNDEGIQTGYAFINSNNSDGTPNENIEQLKSKAFKCDKIEYDSKTGKVNKMHFTEIENYTLKNREILQ